MLMYVDSGRSMVIERSGVRVRPPITSTLGIPPGDFALFSERMRGCWPWLAQLLAKLMLRERHGELERNIVNDMRYLP